MRPFWRSFWASSLANLTIGIIILFFFILIALIFTSGLSNLIEKESLSINDNAILHLKLESPISEKSYAEFDPNSPELLSKSFGIRELKIGLKEAESDNKIKGILINIENLSAGMASVEEIRNTLLDFKESSGKFIYAYSEVYTQKAYYLSTVADEIYLFPNGVVDFRGLGVELMFFKGAIDKLGIDMQIIRGSNNKFKSFVEPFIKNKMSPENREQTMTYLNDLWMNMLTNIKSSRNISIETLNEIADSLYIQNAEDAVTHQLVDKLIFEDELFSLLKEESGLSKKDEINFVSFEKYCMSKIKKNKIQKNNIPKDENIAVIYAVGGIESGKGDNNTIGSETLAKAIRDARENKKIKGIVLRVNSPGGSALASDVIWREVTLAKEEKPFVVSMGDVAASGGYYISCAATRIFAQPNTITGSIGVFGIIPNVGPMMKDKLGITFDRATTNNHSVLSLTKALTDKELTFIQKGVDEIYDDFITKVADGRDGLKKADVDEIGQGRVWSGEDALSIGLIDELGGIDQAIAYVAEQIDINEKDVQIKIYPEDKTETLLEFIELMDLDKSYSNKTANIFYEKFKNYLNAVQNISLLDKYQARLPYEFIIE